MSVLLLLLLLLLLLAVVVSLLSHLCLTAPRRRCLTFVSLLLAVVVSLLSHSSLILLCRLLFHFVLKKVFKKNPLRGAF